MFGRGRTEPVVEPVEWDCPGLFSVTTLVRVSTLRRGKLTGPPAVRVPVMLGGVRHFAPMAFVAATAGEHPSYALYAAVSPDTLLCSLLPEKGGARYRVTDADGTELGTVHRTPAAKRTVQHSWWLRQPGHADIVARYHWARGSAKDIAARGKETAVRGAGSVVGGVVDSVLSFGAEDTNSRSAPAKAITWLADGDEEPTAMTAGHVDGVTTYTPRVGWLDRRLAFALGVLRES
ncbi:hypothetical protein ELQ87_16515 [Streptomyces griseoviridis]|uniref:DUF2071 domain-containing protein n=1 Tax=Streptomyces griseoviridis TaxID=45398 RepID=A0A3Q9KTJ1_STRGD|nr:hypothetical protein [Streptomyces griseoviridis]AZS85726.1 hypothetical protein ELQ87_16515 [Streptomyces griseoviridis]QCN87424.1 hypothetical protein DDJ31_22770 [Streptomyces griseoviridis]